MKLPARCYGKRSGDSSAFIIPRGIVVHGISDRFHYVGDDPYSIDSIIKILADYGFSYHEVIDRDGATHELVDTEPKPYRAFHAGVSEWDGRDDCNDWMLGMALMGVPDDDYTLAQYDELSRRTGLHASRWPIREDYIRGHNEVAPGRKTDPWRFDWTRYRHAIAGFFPPGGAA